MNALPTETMSVLKSRASQPLQVTVKKLQIKTQRNPLRIQPKTVSRINLVKRYAPTVVPDDSVKTTWDEMISVSSSAYIPVPNGERHLPQNITSSTWKQLNHRRARLIDKELAKGHLSMVERKELEGLQKFTAFYLNQIAPLPE